MKKIYTLVFAALCAAVVLSCNKETLVETTADEQTAPVAQGILNPVTLTFETPEPSKVAIDDKGVASWEEGDQVKIICFNADGQAWTSDPITVVGGKITATVEDAEVYYAVYPASATIALENVEGVDNLKVTISDEQDGTFKNACYYAAKTTKDAKTFNFKAISGILKFQADAKYTKAVVRTVEKAAQKCRFDGDALCTFDGSGNLSVAPTFDATTATDITLDQSGTYYMAVVGNAKNEFIIQLSDHDNSYPAKFINKPVEFTPAKIKNAGTVNPVTDVYVSVDGTGDGLSEASPANAADLAYKDTDFLGDDSKNSTITGLLGFTGGWNCLRKDGLTVHFAEGTYTSSYTVGSTGTEGFIVNIIGAGTDKTKFTAKTAFTFSGASQTAKSRLSNLTFDQCTACAVKVTNKNYVGFDRCDFTDNGTVEDSPIANGAALYVAVTNKDADADECILVDCKNCNFTGNETTAQGGVLCVTQGSVGGQVRFNNCYFGSNKATYGSIVYCNNTTQGPAPAMMFNGCTFYKNQATSISGSTGFGYSFYCNTGTRLGLNNCTFNVNNTIGGGNNGSEIVCYGYGIIANSTVWGSAATGKRAMAHFGSKVSLDKPSTIVNSMFQNNNAKKGTKYKSLFLAAGYYLKMWGTIYTGLNDNSTAVSGTHYVFDNCFDRGVADAAPAGAVGKNDGKNDGITHSYYTWTFNSATYPGFTPMTKAEVLEKIRNTESIGPLFADWLNELGALDVDILGGARDTDHMTPGSKQIAWGE